jgi:hypothetical protein
MSVAWGFGIAIVVVLILMVYFGFNAFGNGDEKGKTHPQAVPRKKPMEPGAVTTTIIVLDFTILVVTMILGGILIYNYVNQPVLVLPEAVSTHEPLILIPVTSDPVATPSYPPGTVAVCLDDSLSRLSPAEGTCNGHGGVKHWVY